MLNAKIIYKIMGKVAKVTKKTTARKKKKPTSHIKSVADDMLLELKGGGKYTDELSLSIGKHTTEIFKAARYLENLKLISRYKKGGTGARTIFSLVEDADV